MTDVLPTPQRGLSLGPDVLVGIQDSLSAAERAGGVVVRRYALAGTTVRLRFAGGAVLDSLARAFAHLEVHEDDSEPALTVAFWDLRRPASSPRRDLPCPVSTRRGHCSTSTSLRCALRTSLASRP